MVASLLSILGLAESRTDGDWFWGQFPGDEGDQMTYLFASGVPAVAAASDRVDVTLGLVFSPDTDVDLKAVRIWRGDRVIRMYEARVWERGVDTPIASVKVLVGTTRPGWKAGWLESPVRLRGGREYVVAYRSRTGKYPVTQEFFLEPRDHGVASLGRDAGVFAYRSWPAQPTHSYRHSNYWVDVDLAPVEAPTVPDPDSAPVFTTSPASVSAKEGSTVLFTATAVGTPVPTLGWQRLVGGQWVEIPGATGSSYPLTVMLSDDGRQFRCVAVNRAGAKASDPATVTVQAVPDPLPGEKAWQRGRAWYVGNCGVKTPVKPSPGLRITTPGAVVEGLQCSGPISVEAPDVTIRNVIVHGDGPCAIWNRSTGLVIEDCEIVGGENGVGFGDYVLRRSLVHGQYGDGLKVSSDTTVEDTMVYDLRPAAGAHADGMQMQDGAQRLTIRRNWVESASNAALFLAPDLGPSGPGPVLVDGNMLDGGNYTLYCVDGNNGQYVVRNITITGNMIGSGQYGTHRVNVDVSWSGNVSTSGAPLQL